VGDAGGGEAGGGFIGDRGGLGIVQDRAQQQKYSKRRDTSETCADAMVKLRVVSHGTLRYAGWS
jgi:hypothetical protein